MLILLNTSIFEDGAAGGALSTRNLIKYDKRVYAMKLFALDAMDLEDCRDMLKVRTIVMIFFIIDSHSLLSLFTSLSV